MKVVIFAGGVGTRLWPVSRKKTPKQFEKIVGEKSTLQLAVDRVRPVADPKDIYISSGERYGDLIKSQLPDIPDENVILEPEMRDVGAAVGLAAALLNKIAPHDPFVILWSDHLVKNEELFASVLKSAAELLKKNPNKIVFIGQTSRFASENLGWIESGEKIEEVDSFPIFSFKSFRYRPDKDTAIMFHAESKYVWNPGYFATTPSFLFSQYEKFAPEMASDLQKLSDAWKTDNYKHLLKEIYPKLEKVSFDNLIVEKISPENGCVIKADLGWSDIGAWEALKEALSENESDVITQGNVMIRDCNNGLIHNYTKQLVVGIDLSEFLIINTEDVLLVCPKDSVPKVKAFVQSLEGTEHESLT